MNVRFESVCFAVAFLCDSHEETDLQQCCTFAVEEKQPKVFIIFEGKNLFERCESLATFLGNLHDPLSHSECCKCSERDRERPLSTESREGL